MSKEPVKGDSFEAHLTREQAVGQLDSAGEITLSPQNAQASIGTFQEEKADFFAVKILQALVAAGAQEIKVTCPTGDTFFGGPRKLKIEAFGLDGQALEMESVVENLPTTALGEGAWPPKHLATGLLALLSLKPKQFVLTNHFTGVSLVLQKDGGFKQKLIPAKTVGSKQLQILIKAKIEPSLATLLLDKMFFCSVPVYVNTDISQAHREQYFPLSSSLIDAFKFFETFEPHQISLEGFKPLLDHGEESKRKAFDQVLWRETMEHYERSTGVVVRPLDDDMCSDEKGFQHTAEISYTPKSERPFHRPRRVTEVRPIASRVLDVTNCFWSDSVITFVHHGAYLYRTRAHLGIPGLRIVQSVEGLNLDISQMKVVEDDVLLTLLTEIREQAQALVPKIKERLHAMTPPSIPNPKWVGWATLGTAAVAGLTGGFGMGLLGLAAGYGVLGKAAKVTRTKQATTKSQEQLMKPYFEVVKKLENQKALE